MTKHARILQSIRSGRDILLHCGDQFPKADSPQSEGGRRAQVRFRAYVRHRHRFEIYAEVISSDHLHCIWTMPPDDDDFSTRWRLIKGRFTRHYLQKGGSETALSKSRRRQHERGIWQRRFWEHLIRDDEDLDMHMDYIHYNPVKHGLAACPHHWPYSSFNNWVDRGAYDPDWCCACRRRWVTMPSFSAIEDKVGEPV